MQRAIDLNAKLVEARRRISLEVTLHQVMQAVQMGADLQQYLLNVSELVGQDLIRYRLGLNTPDTTLQARLYQTLLEDQSRLQAPMTEQGYGWDTGGSVAAGKDPSHSGIPGQLRSSGLKPARRQQKPRNRPALVEFCLKKSREAKTLEATLNEQFQAASGRGSDPHGHSRPH